MPRLGRSWAGRRDDPIIAKARESVTGMAPKQLGEHGPSSSGAMRMSAQNNQSIVVPLDTRQTGIAPVAEHGVANSRKQLGRYHAVVKFMRMIPADL